MKQNYFTSILLAAVWLWFIPIATAQNSTTIKPTKVVEITYVDTSIPLSEMTDFNKKRSQLEAKVINNKFDFREDPNQDPKWAGTDPVIQNQTTSLRSGSPNTVEQVLPGVTNDDNFAINGFRVAPPDTQGDVGPNHYVQMTNLLTIIYNKDGSVALGPVPNNYFWSGAVIDGIDFSNENSGDPIVLYDEYEDRWIVSHFSTTYDYVLFAISVTGDPTGAYYRYGMAFPNFPDYPKFGIWDDAIYFTVNEFAGSFAGSSLVGFPKAGLYDGTGSTGFYLFLDTATYPDYGSWLPADADGPTPPPSSTHYTLSRSYGVANTMHMITTEPDWVTPANTVFTITDITVDSYFTSSTINNAQPNGQSLASLGDRLMYRLQYRNFGTHQAMVVNQSVQNVVSGPFGVRWYEMRAAPATTTWSIHQQGTFLPSDGENRWMGSIAMNGLGEIALGYSVASSSTHPCIRFTGQSVAASGTGVMDLPETSIFTGTESQSGIHRWGDYSMMSVDPSDDETFWYTQEHGATGNFGWATQIAEITLGNPQDPAMIAVTPASFTFNVAPDGTDNDLLNIANIALPGDEDLVWTISIAEPPPPPIGHGSQSGNNIHIPPVPESSIVRNNNYESSAGPVPLEGRAIIEQEEVYPMFNTVGSPTIYGIRTSPAPAAYSMFDGAAPGTYTDISSFPSAAFSNATEIDFNDPNFMYEIDHDGVMRKVNLTDGTVTTLGNLGILPYGMGVDYTTGTYYAIDDNNLYTIDVINATATAVGGLGAGAGLIMIGMTFDADGNLYMYDLISDNMWSCNKTTGACTLIGSIGFDANYGQGMAWDGVNEQVVLSAFNNTTFQAEYRVADVTTGNTAFLGKIGPAADLTQFGSICIPAGEAVPGACPWLSVSPDNGSTPAGSSDNVTVSIDATGLLAGTYECQLNISSNASNASEVIVPVTMIVGSPCATTVTNTTQGTTYCTLQDAIAAANADDNITIDAGTLVESGQIVIDKNLTITGAGKDVTIIMTDQNTGSSGDARGWWLVNPGIELNLSDLTLDGTGFLIWQGIRTTGFGTIDNVRFTEIKYQESGPSYSGVAVAAFGNGNVDISNCMFDEIGRVGVLYFGAGITGSNYLSNMYTGKGAGDWLDYGVEVGAGAVALINGSTFSDNTGVASSDGSTSGGILVSTFYGAGTTATISDNLFTANSTGVFVGFDASDASVANVNENNFIGNGFGVQSTASLVDAKFNYWNSATGPTHASHVCGTGDAVSDNVTFLPYYQDAARSVLASSCLPDPVAHWPMDEGTGTFTEDVTANTNDGTLVNGPTWIPGKMSFAINFDGVNDRVDCGTGSEMDMGTNDFSVSTWVKMGPSQNSYTTLLAKGGGSNTDEGYWFVYRSGKFRFYLSNGASRLTAYSDALSITDDTWHHVAVTLDRDGNLIYYVDGTVSGTFNISSFDGQDIASTRSFTMASWQTNSFTHLTGGLDDMRLYHVALTPSEVAILAGGTPPVNEPPVIVAAASASPNPVTLPSQATVEVEANDPNGDPLTYTWSMLTGPGTVTFSPNGTTGSDVSMADFSTDGVYDLRVEITDGTFTISSDVEVTVLPAGSIPNPIAHWPMDEGSGTTAEDVTPNTNDGTLINGTAWAPGISGTGLLFDGVNDRVDSGTGSEQDMGTGDFSISTWIKMDPSQNSYTTVISKGGGSNTDEGYWLMHRSGKFRFYLSNGSSRLVAYSDAVSVTDNNWYHIAVTVERNGNVTFYVDGTSAGTYNIASFNGQDITSTRSLTMGSWQTNSFTYYKGMLDDMRLYDVALTPTEVGILFNLFAPFKNAPASNDRIVKQETEINVFPNPFNESVNIAFTLEEDQNVMVSVYNIHGELISMVQDGLLPQGLHTLKWNGNTQHGNVAPMGIYVVRIIAADKVYNKTLVRNR